MGNFFFRPRVLVVCFALLMAWCAEGETSDCVVVEVFGYETADAGEPVSLLHRRAVRDALKNAVLQTQVELDVQANVEGLRVKNRRVHSRSVGRVESSRVLTSGFMQPTNSPSRVYRVRMEVSVRPLSAEVSSGRWCPAVSLSVHSSRGEEHGKACREALAASLRGCGIRVVDAEADPSAYPVDIDLFQPSATALWEIRWEMEHSSGNPVSAAWEYSQVPAQDLLSSAELGKLGVRIAQDALRLRGGG
jgi:hypothetical protein